MAQQFEMGVVHQVENVIFGAGEKIVHTDDTMAVGQQAFAQMGADEPGSAGNQYLFA